MTVSTATSMISIFWSYFITTSIITSRVSIITSISTVISVMIIFIICTSTCSFTILTSFVNCCYFNFTDILLKLSSTGLCNLATDSFAEDLLVKISHNSFQTKPLLAINSQQRSSSHNPFTAITNARFDLAFCKAS